MFYDSSLPQEPIRSKKLRSPNNTRDLMVPDANPGRISSMMSRQDLDQVSTFSEILDTLKCYPSDAEVDQCAKTSKTNKDILSMAPLGPSQVDIGNLSCCK